MHTPFLPKNHKYGAFGLSSPLPFGLSSPLPFKTVTSYDAGALGFPSQVGKYRRLSELLGTLGIAFSSPVACQVFRVL